MRRKGVAVLVAAAFAVSAPLAFADRGGVPHNPHGALCPSKAVGHAQGPKNTAHNTLGRKCGFNRGL